MTFGKKERDFLIGLAGVVLVLLVVGLVVMPFGKKTDALKAENDVLKPKSEEYIAIDARVNEYEQAIAAYQEDTMEIAQHFPEYIEKKDNVMFWANIAAAYPNDLMFGDVELDAYELVDLAEEQQKSVKIEYDEDGNPITDDTIEQGEINGLSLYRTPMMLDMKSTYKGMKDMFAYINKQSYKNSIDTVDISFDEATGELNGALGVSKYFVTGLQREYEPEFIPKVPVGVPDVFHTVGGVGALRGTIIGMDEMLETEEGAEAAGAAGTTGTAGATGTAGTAGAAGTAAPRP